MSKRTQSRGPRQADEAASSQGVQLQRRGSRLFVVCYLKAHDVVEGPPEQPARPTPGDLATAVALQIAEEDGWNACDPWRGSTSSEDVLQGCLWWNQKVDEIDPERFVRVALALIYKDDKRARLYERYVRWNEEVRTAADLLERVKCTDPSLRRAVSTVRALLTGLEYLPAMFSPLTTSGVGQKRHDPVDDILNFLDARKIPPKEIARILTKTWPKTRPEGSKRVPERAQIIDRLRVLRRKKKLGRNPLGNTAG